MAHRLAKLRIGDTNPDLSATPLAPVSFIELLARVPHTLKKEKKKKKKTVTFLFFHSISSVWGMETSAFNAHNEPVSGAVWNISHTAQPKWMEHERGSREKKNGFHYQLGPLISRWVHFWPELISLRVNLFIPLWRKGEQVKKGTKLKKKGKIVGFF